MSTKLVSVYSRLQMKTLNKCAGGRRSNYAKWRHFDIFIVNLKAIQVINNAFMFNFELWSAYPALICSKSLVETPEKYKICSKLSRKTPERHQWRHSGVFIVNFEHISLILQFLLLTLNKWPPSGEAVPMWILQIVKLVRAS